MANSLLNNTEQSKPTTTFFKAKEEFDKKHKSVSFLKISLVPVNGKIIENIKIRNEKGERIEEYYKWQFIYSLIYSGLYSKDFIGVEVYFPKGSPSSKPIRLDGAIFDDSSWLEKYNNFWQNKNQESLDWLRKHLIVAIEFKKEDGHDIEKYFNQQLKPAMKESEKEFVIGFYYDTERVWIFQKKNNKILRYDESKNQKGEESGTKDLSLHLPDSYLSIPSFDNILNKIVKPKVIDRTKRTIDDLEIISGIHTKQVNDALSNILRTLDKVGLVNQIGYGLLIQILALKIFDEKTNEKNKSKTLRFYITENERKYRSLADPSIQGFITRIKDIYDDAKGVYPTILGQNIIDWKNKSHISAIVSIVVNFQDYSFVKSYKTDLYQLVFYRFANEFAKERKGQFITPIWLIDFLVKIVNPRGNETVIDPCVGIADFLSLSYVNSIPRLDDANLYGIDNDQQMIMLAQLNMLLNGDGNAKLYYISDKGSIDHKIDITGKVVKLIPKYHKNGNWNNWPDRTEIKKFDVVLTNPPFGEDRAYRAKTSEDKEIAECYELWNLCKQKDWIDLGLIFLENAVRLLRENGRLGIVQSNSIASIDRWEKARKWLMDNVRIVALFDLPPNVFADTGANTTLIIAYKPKKKELEKLKNQRYEIFIKDIKRVGYEVRTSRRVKYYNPLWKINEKTFEIETDKEGNPLLDEEFTEIIEEFRKWVLGQEKTLKKLFLGE
ncbi:MAG TPA: SAM-dependent methyltransferase [Candidatus Atribacteria bacterium]|nr:SAM-dependent methyltransferase [Candidatus Atribacteria bacterium]